LKAVNLWRRVQVDGWLQRGQFALLPARCTLCGGAGEGYADICGKCRAELPWLGPACRRCALPLAAEGVCGRCVSRPDDPIARTTAVFQYHGTVTGLILGLKYGGRLSAARLLGGLMAEVLLERIGVAVPEALVPVPLHRTRLRERGFNQAVEIARPLAARLGIELDLNSCERVRNTAEQTRLDSVQRSRNLKGAFRVVRHVPYRRVAIVDDVLTTGSTVASLAGSLRATGVEEIEVWSCARAFVVPG